MVTEEKNRPIAVEDEHTGIDIEKIDESSDPEMRQPFDPTKIDMTVKPLIIDSLIKRMKSKPPRIDLNTEFQRRPDLWNDSTQSQFIESLLVRIPIPAFYFDGTDDNNWKVIDGLQRLTALKSFIIDKSLKLQNLEFLEKYNNTKYDDLPAYLQGRIEETQITVYIINPGTPDNVKYNIFKRINTGGLMLEAQEIRHALNQGIPAQFVKELAELPSFNKATHNILTNHLRMEDRDVVTRFIAFYDGFEGYQSDLDEYLNESMRRLNKQTHEEREKMKNDFIKAMEAAYKLFGEYAFRKRNKIKDRKHPLNKALFDTWSVNLATRPQEELDKLVENKKLVIEKFIELIKDDSFFKAVSAGTGKLNAIKVRFQKIENLINECLQ